MMVFSIVLLLPLILQLLLPVFIGGYWYWRTLKKDWALDEGTTNRFDLPERGKLSGLALRLRYTAAAQNYDLDNRWPFQRADVRLVGNGNVEIIDLRGRMLEALNFWDSGVMPKSNFFSAGSAIAEAYAFLPFGRYMGDPTYGLDLEKFTAGVEFEDTNTFSTTYMTDGTCYYDIVGLFRKGPEPGLFAGGYFKKRQILNKSVASESQYSVKLPTVNKIRQIHLFSEPGLSSHVVADNVFDTLGDIWLGIKSKEEYIINNVDAPLWARWIHHAMNRYPRTSCIVDVKNDSDSFIDTMIYERMATELTGMPASEAARIVDEYRWTYYERVLKVWQFDDSGTRQSGHVQAVSDGIMLHGDIPLLLTDPMAGEDAFLDAAALKDVYVEFNEDSSTGNIYVVLDELQKTYPS